ncbi:MAG: helix-turn-helix domain-containing protein [Dysgonomonas sp.]|uniref:helix-turn-helix domain-containing protein n=1 Tax=Dysgonomonas sp. TaxID=1891233 RepID=UPI0039E2EDE2
MRNIGIIDLEVIDEIITKTQTITREINALKNKHDDKCLGKWMDAQDVCLTLNISPRTLQTYRDEGKIGYTQINRKIYYKSEDVDHFIRNSYNNKLKNNRDENNG